MHEESVPRTYSESNIGPVLNGKFNIPVLGKGVEEKVKQLDSAVGVEKVLGDYQKIAGKMLYVD